ncbi:uncharacterized [Tachysurus ichikawai]
MSRVQRRSGSPPVSHPNAVSMLVCRFTVHSLREDEDGEEKQVIIRPSSLFLHQRVLSMWSHRRGPA